MTQNHLENLDLIHLHLKFLVHLTKEAIVIHIYGFLFLYIYKKNRNFFIKNITKMNMNSSVYEQFLGALNNRNDKKSVEIVEGLVEKENGDFFKMLDALNKLLNSTNSEPVLVTAAKNGKYHFAAYLDTLGCNRLKDENGKRPFDCLSKVQQENVSRCYRMLCDEITERNRRKFKENIVISKDGSIVIEIVPLYIK